MCLPTAVALLTKRVEIASRCTWCLMRDEDTYHVMFDCSFARSVWARANIQEVDSANYTGDIVEFIQYLFFVCTRDKLVHLVMLYWNLWNRRNKWVWNRVSISGFGVQATTMNMINEWQRCQKEKRVFVSAANTIACTWKPPAQGWFKVNVDAALFTDSAGFGIGCVIRDASGGFVAARTQKIEAIITPKEAEAIGLKEALSWTKELRHKRCVFETDAKLLAEACKGVQRWTYFHTIVLDSIELFKNYDDVLVEFILRSANEVAHRLARATYSMSGVKEWVHNPPSFICDVLSLDYN
ncbi:uncharacterized protein LOC141708859 [Apium graveolens]|uniref:uncharacterized protein LOC141708859 n=1 Tax=Apium graveolens TaxID=4045 RepID=UPI003D7BF419